MNCCERRVWYLSGAFEPDRNLFAEADHRSPHAGDAEETLTAHKEAGRVLIDSDMSRGARGSHPF